MASDLGLFCAKVPHSSSLNAVEVQDLWFSYGPRRSVLKGVSFTVKKGSASVLVGPNGSGKTTILKVISGILSAERGRVKVHGEDLSTKSTRQWRARTGYIPQQLGLVKNLAVLENVMTGALSRLGPLPSLVKVFPKEELDLAWKSMDAVGIAHKAREKVHRLSGGERQRVAVARALMQKPRVILADEFTSGLDYAAAQNILDIMSEVRKEGVTLLMATHNLEMAMAYGEQAIFLKEGTIVGEMRASELSEEVIRRIFVET